MEEKKGFFRRLVSGLTKTRDNIVSGMDSIFHGFSKIDDDFYEELEEQLIMGDLGVHATMGILDDLRQKVKEQHIREPIACRQLLIDSIKEQMDVGETAYEFENRTSVVFVIGVNGVGKTTTIGKLAGKLKQQNKKVVLAAAKFDNKMYATTAPNIAGKYEDKENGRYIWSDSQEIQVYGDAMVLFNKEFDDFSLNTALGASINMSKVNSLTIDSTTPSTNRMYLPSPM